ncbi:MAG: ABC transporter permease [Clostridia bacterium]|nr:ABC transporter permease [Clostridia bacterium]
MRPVSWVRRFRQNRQALVGLGILAVLLLAALLGPLLSPYDPYSQDLAHAFVRPGAAHPLGTDYLGRDIATRLAVGGRLSLLIGLLSVAIGLVAGVPLALLSGYWGGWIDLVIQRLTDVLLSFPSILLALGLVAVLGVGVQNVIVAVGISTVPLFIRVTRSAVLSVREQLYVEAARALGASSARILARHVLPNVLAPVIVQATLSVGLAILNAAGLGFLGLGVQPPAAEWGTMLGEGRNYIFSAPYVTTFPGLVIFLAVLAFNLVGDGLRDALDPYLHAEGAGLAAAEAGEPVVAQGEAAGGPVGEARLP